MKNPQDKLGLSLRTREDRAYVLSVICSLVFIPPIANMFVVANRVFHVPVIVAYLFIVWAILIFCAWYVAQSRVSRIVGNETPPPEDADPNIPGGGMSV